MGLMNIFPFGLAGDRLCLLSLYAVRFLADTQEAFRVYLFLVLVFWDSFFCFLFLPLVLLSLIHLKHYHPINLPKIKFLFLIAFFKARMISHCPRDELLDSAC